MAVVVFKMLLCMLMILSVVSCGNSNDAVGDYRPSLVMEGAISPEAMRHPNYAGELVALRRGFFRDGGLDLTLAPVGEDDPIHRVTSGRDTFGAVGVNSFLSAVNEGAPLIAIAAQYLRSPIVFYSLNRSVSNPKDLIGKRVGLQAGSDAEVIYFTMLQKNKIARNLLDEVPVGHGITPLLTREVDIMPGDGIYDSAHLTTIRTRYSIIDPAAHGVSYLGTVYFTTKKTVSENSELVQAFVNGVIRGWEFAYSDKDAAALDLISYRPRAFDVRSVQGFLKSRHTYIKPEGMSYGEYTNAQWQEATSALKRLGRIADDLNYNDHVSFEFLQRYSPSE